MFVWKLAKFSVLLTHAKSAKANVWTLSSETFTGVTATNECKTHIGSVLCVRYEMSNAKNCIWQIDFYADAEESGDFRFQYCTNSRGEVCLPNSALFEVDSLDQKNSNFAHEYDVTNPASKKCRKILLLWNRLDVISVAFEFFLFSYCFISVEQIHFSLSLS